MLWTLERFGPLWIEITFKSCDENLNENDISKGRKSSFLDKLWRTSLKLPATPQTSLKRSVSIEVMISLSHCTNLGRYVGKFLSRSNGNNPGTKRWRRRGWWSSQKERQEQVIPPISSQAEIGDPPTCLTPMSRSKSRSRKGHQAPLPTPASLGEERSNQVMLKLT